MRATQDHLFVGIDDIRATVHGSFKDGNLPIDEHQLEEGVKAFEKEFGKKVVVIGERDGQQSVFHIDMCITPVDEKIVLVAKSIDPDSSITARLDDESAKLEQQGFTTVRLPYFADGTLHITYNNALLERYTDRNGKEVQRVYLPQYYAGSREDPVYTHVRGGKQIDLKKMNEDAVKIYRKQGYEIVPIAVSVRIIQMSGSLNCITFEDREK